MQSRGGQSSKCAAAAAGKEFDPSAHVGKKFRKIREKTTIEFQLLVQRFTFLSYFQFRFFQIIIVLNQNGKGKEF